MEAIGGWTKRERTEEQRGNSTTTRVSVHPQPMTQFENGGFTSTPCGRGRRHPPLLQQHGD